MKKSYATYVFAVFFSHAIAQTDTIQLSEIEVNANRIHSKYKDQLRVVQIIDKYEIMQLPSLSISEILDYAGNVDVRQRGIHNVQSDISIRGGNYEQTLIMVNGIPVNDPQTGHHSMNIPISTELIDRIEILSGGDARQYGSNAFAGVINIVTKQSEDKSLSLKLYGGDFQYFGGNIHGNVKFLNTMQQFSVSHNQSSGHRPNTDFSHTQISWQTFLKQKNSNTQAFIAVENKAFGAQAFYTPKYPNQFENTKCLLSAATHKMYFKNSNWTTQAYYRQHHDRFELFRQSMTSIQVPSWYKNHNYHMTQVIGGQTNIALFSNLGKTTIGADIRYEHIYSNVLGTPMNDTIVAPFETNGFFTKEASKKASSIFIDHSLQHKQWQWSAGFMATYINFQNLFFYPGTEIGYNLNEHIKVFASANRSLRLPTYTELYYKDPIHEGNHQLKPEQANQFESGFKFQHQQWQAQLATYYRQGFNIIDWVRINETDKWRSQNISEVNIIGTEATIIFTPTNDNFKYFQKIKINYSYNHITKQTGQYFSKYALDILRHKFSFTSIHNLYKNLFFSWTLLYHERSGTYTEFPTGKEKNYTPYLTIDAQIQYKYKTIMLFIQGNNLFDTYYYDIANIPMPGRWVKGGIYYEWK
ncbi:MAG: TonB-dependent receptor [Bacteroidales bacterium]|nr:TonB-dependent receptor [Bacteroidales bacterium]